MQAPEPPALLLLGTDAVNVVTGVLDGQRAEIEKWTKLSLTTDFY